MTKVNHTVMGSKTEDGEITFIDVLGFLRRNWKFLGLLTGVLSAAAVTLVLLLPKEYQKEVTLVITLAPSELLAEVREQSEALPSQDQLGNSAESSLQGEDFGDVEVVPKYDAPTRRINVVLRSGNEDSLAGATPGMVSFLETRLQETYERDFDGAVEKALTNAERDVEAQRASVNRAEQEFEQASGTTREAAMSGAVSGTFVLLAQAESKLENLEQTREELPRLKAEAVSVEVLTESDVQQVRTTAALVLLAVVASFAAAVALALAREALARRK